MASYRIEWKVSATKELKKLPTDTIIRILKAVDGLFENPRPVGARKLVGTEDSYRLRVGDYRIIYSIQDQVCLIEIIRVGHRRDIYRP